MNKEKECALENSSYNDKYNVMNAHFRALKRENQMWKCEGKQYPIGYESRLEEQKPGQSPKVGKSNNSVKQNSQMNRSNRGKKQWPTKNLVAASHKANLARTGVGFNQASF